MNSKQVKGYAKLYDQTVKEIIKTITADVEEWLGDVCENLSSTLAHDKLYKLGLDHENVKQFDFALREEVIATLNKRLRKS